MNDHAFVSMLCHRYERAFEFVGVRHADDMKSDSAGLRRRLRRRRQESDNDINLEMSEINGKDSDTIAAALSGPPFDDDIRAFDVPLIP